jgi:hypothetical protein
MVISQVSFCSFCRRRTLEYLRRAVYCRDGETRAKLTRLATAWAELARAAGSLEDTAPQVR